jgi:phosphonate transport system substrate-binding protein
MKRGVSLFVLMAAVLILAACAVPAPPQAAPTGGEAPAPAAAPELGTPDNPLVMSFVPSGDTQEIIAGGEEIEKMLEDITGLSVDSNVATSYAAVVEAMGAGNAHIGWLNTFGYLLAHEKYGVEPLLVTIRFGSPSYKGQIVVRKDSGIESLTDLKGKTMCWVDPLSTSGYIIPRVVLQAAGVNPDTDFAKTIEAGSHNNVIIAVYNGECDAGATYVDARNSVEKELADVKEQVVPIVESPDIPNDNVSVIPSLPDEMKQAIKDALLQIASTEEGKTALKTVYSIEDLKPTDDSFYDGFRAQLDAAGVSIEDLAK